MCLYLTKRNSTYYFRRAIPPELRTILGGREFTFSLGTKDKEEAKRLRSEHALRTDALIDEAWAKMREQVAPVEAKAPPMIDGQWLGEFAEEEAAFAARKTAEREARRLARRHFRDEWRERLDGTTARMPPRYAALKDLIREQEERAAAAEARAKALEAQNTPTAISPRPSNPSRSGAPIMLDATIVDMWAAERKPTQKGIDTHRAVARWLYERVGRKPVDQLTTDDFRAFKAKLIEEGQSAANIKMKLSRVRTLMQWAFENGYASANTAAGVAIKDTKAGKNERKPFDLPALTAIFASPVYSDGLRPVRLRGEAGYWLPLLALFTGARLEELGQLTPEDVRERRYADDEGNERSAWFIHIREDSEAGLKLKNANSERHIPVHGELVRLGFLTVVTAAKDVGQQRLFPLLRPDKYGRLTAKWGEHWSVYRRDICGVTDRRMVFHSFRHTFKDYARLAGIDEGVQRQLMGHSARDVADEYGSGHSDHQLVEAMKRYRVPGLRLGERLPITEAA
jgi:integrase